MDPLDRLCELIPPPDGIEPLDWAAAERRFDLRFPVAYKGLVDRYGVGVFGGDFELLVPDDYLAESLQLNDQVQSDRAAEGSWPDPLRPQPGALVSWLKTGNATEVHWTVGAEDEQQVYLSYREDWRQELPGSPVDVLLAFATGEAVPQDYEAGEFEATFEPLEG